MSKIEIIGTLIASIATILGGVWYMLRLSFRSGIDKNRFDELEDKCKKLPEKISDLSLKIENMPCSNHMEKIKEHKIFLDSHVEKYNTITSDVSGIKVSIDFMQRTIEALNSNVQNIGNPNRIILTQSKSPLDLTQQGYEAAKRVGMYEMIESNWDNIHSLIERNVGSKNPYDIQQFCIVQTSVFPEKFISEHNINKLKIEAYNSGTPITEYMRVFSVIIRNKYFREHGINVNDVDKHDPIRANK